MADLVPPILWAALVPVAAGVVFCLYIRAQTASAVGAVRLALCPKSLSRRAHLVLVVLCLPAVLFLAEPSRIPAAGILVAALAILWLRPSFADSVWGADGVRRGWFARRYEDLDEWRLTGQHLRWRLYGVWQATEVPTAEHAELRARLEGLIGDRESPFRA